MVLLLSVLEQGMIYAIMALGVYITYKILDFPDLTVDGSFPMGAAITAVMISRDMNPLLTLPVSFGAGVLVGICTGLIHVKLKVRDLLSGIIMMTGLYSINLAVAGRANLPIYNKTTIFENDFVKKYCPAFLEDFDKVIIIAVIMLISKYLPVGAVLIPGLFVIPAFLCMGTEAGIIAVILAALMLLRHWPGLRNIPSGTEPRMDLLGKLRRGNNE